MKNKLLFAVAGVLVFALGGLFAWADAPGLLNYQGRISIGSNPFTGTGLFKFALVNQAGDQTYWSND